MNQIKKDMLLKIHSHHPITCPLINSLQFSGLKSSKIYEVSLDEAPNYLYVDTSELISLMHHLDKWANDLLGFEDRLPEDIKSELNEKMNVSNMRNNISMLLDDNHEIEIKKSEKTINTIIAKWEKLYDEHIENKSDCRDLVIQKKIRERSISRYDKSHSEYKRLSAEINQLNIHISNLETDMDNEQVYFFNNIETQFNQATLEFTNFLEEVRERNHLLRTELTDFREFIIEASKSKLKLYQPMEYLNQKFGITDKLTNNPVVNLGLLKNNFEYMSINSDMNKNGNWYFSKLVGHLEKKSIITKEQKLNLLTDIDLHKNDHNIETIRKENLFKLLKINGYKQVRYYENINAYLINTDSFKTEILDKQQNKLKANI